MCVHVHARKGVLPKVDRPLVVSSANIPYWGASLTRKQNPQSLQGSSFSEKFLKQRQDVLFFILGITFYFLVMLFLSSKELSGLMRALKWAEVQIMRGAEERR